MPEVNKTQQMERIAVGKDTKVASKRKLIKPTYVQIKLKLISEVDKLL